MRPPNLQQQRRRLEKGSVKSSEVTNVGPDKKELVSSAIREILIRLGRSKHAASVTRTDFQWLTTACMTAKGATLPKAGAGAQLIGD